MWTEFFSVSNVLSFILSLAACLYVARIATQLRELRDRKEACGPSRIKSLETSLQETQDALAELANRVKMMKVRGAANHVRDEKRASGEPDPYVDPDRWRNETNKKLALHNLR